GIRPFPRVASITAGAGNRRRAHCNEHACRRRIRTGLMDFEFWPFGDGHHARAVAPSSRGRTCACTGELPQGSHRRSCPKSQKGKKQNVPGGPQHVEVSEQQTKVFREKNKFSSGNLSPRKKVFPPQGEMAPAAKGPAAGSERRSVDRQ